MLSCLNLPQLTSTVFFCNDVIFQQCETNDYGETPCVLLEIFQLTSVHSFQILFKFSKFHILLAKAFVVLSRFLIRVSSWTLALLFLDSGMILGGLC